MESAELHALRWLLNWRRTERRAALITVVRTYGSSPRPAGSIAVLCDDGRIVGSVSGGCIEDDLMRRFTEEGFGDIRLLRYGEPEGRGERYGLPCGGVLEVLVEPDPEVAALAVAVERLESRQLTVREVDLPTRTVRIWPAAADAAFSFNGRRLRCVYGPSWRLMLIGAGQLSRHLALIASGLDDEVTVCDPRPEYADSWDLPSVPLLRTMPDDAVKSLAPDMRTAVIALAHDPRIDDFALMEALDSPAYYVGALGSVANNVRRRQRLSALGVSSVGLARLHGPVGLAIGSRTPGEIAISIIADLIRVRRPLAAEVRPHVAATTFQ